MGEKLSGVEGETKTGVGDDRVGAGSGNDAREEGGFLLKTESRSDARMNPTR
jgi:hypothetical protein